MILDYIVLVNRSLLDVGKEDVCDGLTIQMYDLVMITAHSMCRAAQFFQLCNIGLCWTPAHLSFWSGISQPKKWRNKCWDEFSEKKQLG